MAGIKKRTRAGKAYYYLYQDSYKNGRKQYDRYLGPEIPDNIDEIRGDFEREVYLKEWAPELTKIHKNYSAEKKLQTYEEREKKNHEFSLEFNYNTQKIEGSKLTRKETFDLIELKVSPKEKPMHDIKETEAHDRIFDRMIRYVDDLDESMVVAWHKELLQDTKPDKAGIIRTTPVGIMGSKFTPPPGVIVKRLLDAFFVWYKENETKIHPVILAALVHQKFVTIHPFRDGNGRISRLLVNFILKTHCYPMMVIESGDRTKYYRALERSQTQEKENIFVKWFVDDYLRKNAIYL